MDQLHEIRVPAGIGEGQTFQIMIAGALMSVTCPAGVRAGDVIQVAVPMNIPPTVQGVPVSPDAVGARGMPVMTGQQVGEHQRIRLVEVEEISPAGWFCLIVGCFACPGLNLLGLCMRERRLVPASEVEWAY